MSDPLVPKIIQEDSVRHRQQEIRQQLFAELRAVDITGTYSDAQWEAATLAVEKIGETLPITLGDPDKMGESSYIQYYFNCRHIARVVMEAFGNKRVPREPTQAMIAVGAEKWNEYDSRRHTASDMAATMWRFMYDAAVGDQENMHKPR